MGGRSSIRKEGSAELFGQSGGAEGWLQTLCMSVTGELRMRNSRSFRCRSKGQTAMDVQIEGAVDLEG
jgi:hypothetical protein